jgi:hypothetical protein
MIAQHTPGPWHINASGYCQGSPCRWEIVAKSGGIVAETNDGTDMANARLLASAPEMFDALQAIVDAYGERDTLLMAQVKAALAKAKGEA